MDVRCKIQETEPMDLRVWLEDLEQAGERITMGDNRRQDCSQHQQDEKEGNTVISDHPAGEMEEEGRSRAALPVTGKRGQRRKPTLGRLGRRQLELPLPHQDTHIGLSLLPWLLGRLHKLLPREQQGLVSDVILPYHHYYISESAV